MHVPHTCTSAHTQAHMCTLPAHARARTAYVHTHVHCAHAMHTCRSTRIHARMHVLPRRTHIQTYTGIPCTPRGEGHAPRHIPAGGSRTWAWFGLEAPESTGQADGLWVDRPANPDPGKGSGDPWPALTASSASRHPRGEAPGLLHPTPQHSWPPHLVSTLPAACKQDGCTSR